VGKMSRFWQFCDFQEIAKVHRSQKPLRRVHYILHKYSVMYVYSFRPLFQICDSLTVCYSEVIRLESGEVREKSSPNCGAKFADFRLSKCGDTDRAAFGLRYKLTPHSDILAKGPARRCSSASKIRAQKIIN